MKDELEVLLAQIIELDDCRCSIGEPVQQGTAYGSYTSHLMSHFMIQGVS